ncbi:MAG: helix-turn-helix transcriptional regulator [Colwellia sp.]|nr:helix-turn-helix transcriptional regulator [Colwellia sp.]MCW8863291.1 helix-turn-helix transcriptional regulator [Colwellia sp.]MCW9081274.1 helix-turn-helix transcriptional regulator [Colwellia sp.]
MVDEKNGGRECPIEETMKIFAGKWKASILYHLREGECRFNELRRRIPGITQRMLTQQLRELERDGLVIRKSYDEIQPKVEYSLSEVTHSLDALFAAIELWGRTHAQVIAEARHDYDLQHKAELL